MSYFKCQTVNVKCKHIVISRTVLDYNQIVLIRLAHRLCTDFHYVLFQFYWTLKVLGDLWTLTSSWRPFWPLDFVLCTHRALTPQETRRYFCQSKKLSKFRSFCHQQIFGSSFRFQDIVTGSRNQKAPENSVILPPVDLW